MDNISQDKQNELELDEDISTIKSIMPIPNNEKEFREWLYKKPDTELQISDE